MKRATFIIAILFISLVSFGEEWRSTFNDGKFNCDKNHYNFIVSGHFYGNSGTGGSFPVNTILANLDTLNQMPASFMVSLGDLFMDVNPRIISNYRESFFDKLEMPLFNVVGNHDLAGNVYESHFGKTFFYYSCNEDHYLFLDSEMDNSDIKGEQLKLFNKVVENIKDEKNARLFIFSHRPVWAEKNEALKGVFTHNTKSKFGSNYLDELRPALLELQAPVYWFGGSLGPAPASFFYHEDENIHYIATAIRGLDRDAVLQVELKDEVRFNTISLTGKEVKPLKEYNKEFWLSYRSNPMKEFNYRLIPYLTLKAVTHRYFWYGFLLCLILFFAGIYALKRYKKR